MSLSFNPDNLLPAVVSHLDAVGIRIVCRRLGSAARHYHEGALAEHTWEASTTVTDDEGLGGVVIAQLYGGIPTCFVTIVYALVLIQRELASAPSYTYMRSVSAWR